MPDYSNGKIYTIRCRTNESLIYVGSTIQPLSKRFHAHKSHKGCSLYEYVNENHLNWNDWYIELYENYSCKSKEELLKKEGEIIRNIATINKKIAGRTDKEYRIDNADKIKEKYKEYYIENPDKIKERKKEYYIKNADKIKEYNIKRVDKKKEYDKEYRIQNADKKKEQDKEYYIKNTHKIKDYNKEYYIQNVDKIKEQYKEYRKEYYANKRIIKFLNLIK